MVVRKRRKHTRFRGNRHYHGSHKKHKGAGHRGGVGEAGLHKHNWTYVVKYDPDHYGKRGFTRHPSLVEKVKTINLKDLDQMISKLDQKTAEKEEGKIKVNLEKLGYQKLLGTGKITKPVVVESKYFSKTAAKKIEESGGKTVTI